MKLVRKPTRPRLMWDYQLSKYTDLDEFQETFINITKRSQTCIYVQRKK